MKIEDVISKGWNDNKRDRGSNSSFSYRKEDDSFYSYNTKIAFIDRWNETLTIIGLNKEYGNYISQTTSQHFGRLEKFCLDNGLKYTIKILD